jgi:hypothetical protein
MTHQLYIDGQLADIAEDTNVTFTIVSNLLTGAADFKGNRTLTIDLPATVNNRRLINMAQVVQGGGDYPYQFHNVDYYRNGVPIIQGGIGRLVSTDTEKIHIAIVWGVRTAVEALLGSDKSIASLTTNAGITFNSLPQVSDYDDALADDVFYAAMDTMVHDSPNDIYHVNVGIGSDRYEYAEDRTASSLLHPSVRMDWILSLMESQYNAHIDWGTAMTDIGQMIVPLIGKVPNDATFSYGYTATSNGTLGNVIKLRTTHNSAIIAQTTSSQPTTALTCATAFKGLVKYSCYFYINEQDLIRVAYPIYKTRYGYSVGIHAAGTHHWCTIVPEGYLFQANKIHSGELAIYATGYLNVEMAVGDTLSIALGTTSGGMFDANSAGDLNVAGCTLYIAEIIGTEDEVQPGQWYPVEGNLPDIKPVDLVKFLAAVTGVFPVQSSTSDTLVMKPVASVFDISRAVDWSSRLLSPAPRPVPAGKAFSVDGWAQRNWWRWKDDDTVSGSYDGSIDVADETLPVERNVMEFPFAATDGNNVPMYTSEEKNGTVQRKYKAVQPRVLTLIEGETSKAEAMFTLDMTRILADKYGDLAASLRKPSVITETIRINDVELSQVDETKPILLKQHGAYFALLELSVKGNGTAEAKLLRIVKQEEI